MVGQTPGDSRQPTGFRKAGHHRRWIEAGTEPAQTLIGYSHQPSAKSTEKSPSASRPDGMLSWAIDTRRFGIRGKHKRALTNTDIPYTIPLTRRSCAHADEAGRSNGGLLCKEDRN